MSIDSLKDMRVDYDKNEHFRKHKNLIDIIVMVFINF